jgi:hypothetical protein
MATKDIFKRMYAKKGVCTVCGGMGGVHCKDTSATLGGNPRKVVRGGKFKKALRRMARRRLKGVRYE